MSKIEPKIQKFMTCQPHFIDAGETLETATQQMKDFGIRHLPVMDGGRVAGILSDRDIKNALGLLGVSPGELHVKDIHQEHPYVVAPDAKLHEVAEEMAEKRYGSAIVVQNGKLVGIFTTVDACRALVEILAQRFHGQ